ncbi:hypothetical protein [Aliiglaciecola sp. LCG003]|uniref:hypothetical protein n=1 Tax=Aliiglaciecola sp. LCG003 TaxID=3053655 RepID=UPI002572F42B|nr:hypothetical protein [Aliiglaciecola sp. LCG003]WJG09561.1 hypothetical protein QR722_00555 [Aliiglaciecola sp. LCG003]
MDGSVNSVSPNKIVLVGLLSIFWVLALTFSLVYFANQYFGQDFFVGWVSLAFMCATPFQIVQAIVWHNSIPKVVTTVGQPLKGLIMTAMFCVASLIVTTILYFTIGQGILSPILIHFVIQSVVVSLFVVIAFGCWPMTQFFTHPIALGIATLVYCYVLNLALFMIFYDYHFFAELPFYPHSLDPGGLFNGITALTFAVTCASVLMVVTMFDLWPAALLVNSDKQPQLGLVVTIQILILTFLVYYLFVNILAMDPMDFMVKGPVCIIFGTFLVQNMMQFQLFSNLQQPLKGVLKSGICFVGAFIMYQLYQFILPLMVGETLIAGPERGYAKEIWIATAMLGITFPVINFVSGGFDFWPVKRKS